MASTHMLRQTIIVNEGDSPLAYKAREVTNPVMQYVSFFDNNFERKQKVEVWNGASGKNVEPLLRSIQSFRNISSEWGLNQGRQEKALFKQFLTVELHMTYQRISDAHGNSVQDFEDSVNEFICKYTGENPKYQANMYLFDTSNHIRKPYTTEIGIHANRLKTLFMYHDMLPGNCSNVNDENNPGQIRKRKLALFRSFPIDWQGDFINLRNDPANDDNITWKHIVSWMTQKKRTVDRKKLMQESSPRRTRPGNRTGGRGLHHNRFGGGRGHGQPRNGYQPYPRPSNSPRYSQGTSQRFQRGGNSQQQDQGRFQPRHPNNGSRGRGFNGQRSGRSQSGRFQPGRNYQGRGQSQQQNSQNYLLSRTTIKKLKALLRNAAFRNRTKTECLMAECQVPSSTSIRNNIIKLKKISNGMINSTMNKKNIILKNRRRTNIFPMMRIRHFPFMKSITDPKILVN
ncbi:unnamed protein product [Cylindrotheca closterium]|uniref:Uncharacterized protein n=1 Tax=Cylindrotheca closterium TaxID=2856 RepID=A0AAD2FXI2_9STRA|nr:unnamed protein product [Cylindrotheca closterium]